MPTLPKMRCPGCGKGLGPVTAKEIPPAETYNQCLRRCPRCLIGLTNAKNPAKVRYLRADGAGEPQARPPAQPT